MWCTRQVEATGRDIFGDIALLVFLIAQASDGVLTYVGVSTYGCTSRPTAIIGWLMSLIGEGAALDHREGRGAASSGLRFISRRPPRPSPRTGRVHPCGADVSMRMLRRRSCRACVPGSPSCFY